MEAGKGDEMNPCREKRPVLGEPELVALAARVRRLCQVLKEQEDLTDVPGVGDDLTDAPGVGDDERTVMLKVGDDELTDVPVVND